MEMQKQEKGWLTLESEEGQRILKETKDKGEYCSYDVIWPYFEKQKHDTFCGIQSTVILLNSFHSKPVYSEEHLTTRLCSQL